MPFYRRNDLRDVAQAKLIDAQLLLENRRWSNAYYLAGYSIEIGLKACIAKQMSAEVLPDKSFVNEVYKHDLTRLVGLAGLTLELRSKSDADAAFGTNWAIVGQWHSEKRYEPVDQFSAQNMLAAISDHTSGVFPWIQIYW